MTFNNVAVEANVMSKLKDFQRVTVERIASLYESGEQNRILVADEVGLGKTLIARGLIAKTTGAYLKNEENKTFKVVYVCSNLSIAKQNIKKLRISNDIDIDENIADTRLSMLHLQIAQKESDSLVNKKPIQLIALTPGTSFSITRGQGKRRERALMYCILANYLRIPMDCMLEKSDRLIRLLMGQTKKKEVFWSSVVEMQEKIDRLDRKAKKAYYSRVKTLIDEYNSKFGVIDKLKKHLHLHSREVFKTEKNLLIRRLRVMFAQISTQMLEPNLVIMDEFQRFKFLIQAEGNVEQKLISAKSLQELDEEVIANNFLRNENTKVLLLSATPYKLYSTLEEIYSSVNDEESKKGNDKNSLTGDHYKEFKQVTDFLFRKKNTDFETIWSKYSLELQHLHTESLDVFRGTKHTAEDKLYNGICRTERIAAMDDGDFINTAIVPVKITPDDIKSYMQFCELLKDIDVHVTLPVDYVKSSPFLLSFMMNYKVKTLIEDYFYNAEHGNDFDKLAKPLLWLNREDISKYKELPKSNARLECLKEQLFSNGGELLLWVPPSKPYYTLQGAYAGKENFSKILVFSAWEMVPRMIGSLISYEAERLTVGKVNMVAKNINEKAKNYFSRPRYPYPRLKLTKNSAGIFCLLYPSRTLADIYNPIKLQKVNNLAEIEETIAAELKPMLEELRLKYERVESFRDNKEDAKWYYYAPMLLDSRNSPSFMWKWVEVMTSRNGAKDDESDNLNSKQNGDYRDTLEDIKNFDKEKFRLGKMPKDLLSTLVNMALGSPAVCAYRSDMAGYDQIRRSVEVARIFLHNFNSTEATAIVDLIYGAQSDDYHWQNVLKYCKDGCFQAMFDEYQHILAEDVSFENGVNVADAVQDRMCEALNIRTANYFADTREQLIDDCLKDEEEKTEDKGIAFRANFAMGFIDVGQENEKNSIRKDNVRKAFNSPMRPFVLATTSIGQEGLDFHCYCRKVMHWNLPSNPVDLEQREGRVNRFKCLAVRQSIAKKYGDIEFKHNVWKEMFDAAIKGKEEGCSELVPFWCMGKNQECKIERIVPMYPLSKDMLKYRRLIKVLSLYRLTLGQPRQEEVIDYIYKNIKDTASLKDLYICLCPFIKSKELLKPLSAYVYKPEKNVYEETFSDMDCCTQTRDSSLTNKDWFSILR